MKVAIITDKFKLNTKALALSALILAVRWRIYWYYKSSFFPTDKLKR